MIWVRRYGQAAGWLFFGIAFLIVASAPKATLMAIAFYAIAGALFIVTIVDRRRA